MRTLVRSAAAFRPPRLPFGDMTLTLTLRTAFSRARSLVLVGLLPLLTGGWTSGHQSTFETHGPVAKTQLDVFYVTLWVSMILFVLVAAVLAYATLRFRIRSSDSNNQPPPEQSHGNPLIEIGLIVLSIGALVIIAVPTMRAIWFTYDVPEAERANA